MPARQREPFASRRTVHRGVVHRRGHGVLRAGACSGDRPVAVHTAIVSSGGKSGSPATTLIIRAMALGHVWLRDWLRASFYTERCSD